MKKVIILFLFPIFAFSQIQKEVDNGVFVTFPNTPEYSVVQGYRNYTAKTDNSFFMVQIFDIPQRMEYLKAEQKFSQSEKKEAAFSFLDNMVKGMSSSLGVSPKIQNIQEGSYYGRKLQYNAHNPATGEITQRTDVVLFVRGRAISFKYIAIFDNETSESEKETFINSITAK